MAKRRKKRNRRQSEEQLKIHHVLHLVEDTPIIIDHLDVKEFVDRWDNIFGFSSDPHVNKLLGCYPMKELPSGRITQNWIMQASIQSDMHLSILNSLALDNKNIDVDDIEISGEWVEVYFTRKLADYHL